MVVLIAPLSSFVPTRSCPAGLKQREDASISLGAVAITVAASQVQMWSLGLISDRTTQFDSSLIPAAASQVQMYARVDAEQTGDVRIREAVPSKEGEDRLGPVAGADAEVDGFPGPRAAAPLTSTPARGTSQTATR